LIRGLNAACRFCLKKRGKEEDTWPEKERMVREISGEEKKHVGKVKDPALLKS